MIPLFCVSAGQYITKKTNNIINTRNLYLNYGLLSLASVLKRSGLNPIQIHGHFDPPEMTFSTALELGIDKANLPILISIPSYYAVPWARDFCDLIKQKNSRVKIIVGGRWVIGNRIDLAKNSLPLADVITPGLADSIIRDVVSQNSNISQDSKPIKVDTLHSTLDYSILLNREIYQPSIEVSRGCGMGCSFCQERGEARIPLKNPEMLLQEFKSIRNSDNLKEMTPYLEASMFLPHTKWIKEFRNSIELNACFFHWRAESRVDTLNPNLIPQLANIGLKVLDLGLESGSHTQLIKMGKTKDPKGYLQRASEIIRASARHNIKVKINILLYAGETSETISETIDWLEKHRSDIFGLSVGPVIVFGWKPEVSNYVDSLNNAGASVSHSPVDGVQHLNLSKDIDFEQSIHLSNDISRRFMSMDNYFYLKSFSYFPRYYTYENFTSDINTIEDKKTLSYRINTTDPMITDIKTIHRHRTITELSIH